MFAPTHRPGATLRSASPRAPHGKPDFREGSYVDERDKYGRHVARYKVGRLLGRGGFAKCYEVQDVDTRQVWAMKAVDKQTLQKTKTFQKMQSEIAIHRRMKHANIITFHKSFSDEFFVYILLEKCDNQTLMELSKQRRRFSVQETQHVMVQSIAALEYMHRNNIIHRDLKLGNMMLDRDMNVKIGDFGLAAELQFDGERKRTICGTPNYIAPEILENARDGHSFEVDVWSLGVIFYTLLVGEPPFQTSDVKMTYNRIKQCRYTFPPHVTVSEEAKGLIKRILQSSPDRRPTLHDIRTDPFFRYPVPPSAAPASMFTEAQRRARDAALLRKPEEAPGREALRPVADNQTPGQKPAAYAAPSSARSPQRRHSMPTAGPAPHTGRTRSNSVPGRPSAEVTPRTSAGWPGAAKEAVVPERPVMAKEAAASAARVEDDAERNQLAAAHDQLHQSLVAPPASMPEPTDAVPQPAVWVTDYADFSAKYGLAYKLSTGHTGVHYNDSTKMVWEATTGGSEYYARVKETINGVVHACDQRTPFQMEAAPESLNKKVTLIKYFKSYLARSKGRRDGVEVVACSPFAAPATPPLTAANMTSDMVYVKRWMLTPEAMIFRLSNKAIQVCFFDKTEVILMSDQKAVAFTDQAGQRRCMFLASAALQRDEVASRLRYTKDILCKLISNREL